MRLHLHTQLVLASTLLLLGAGAGQVHAQSNPQDAEHATRQTNSQQSPAPHQHDGMPGTHHDGSMPGMNMEDDAGNHAQAGAMKSMTHGHMDSAHMLMTPVRPATDEDHRRADQVSAALAQAIEKYRDYRVALADGFHIFAPNLPQAQYHFTNYWNGYLEGFTFDPARPTSLLYKKTKDGYELIGAMYTAPRTATLDELNERIPLGVARWHQHTNLCMPKRGQGVHADWTKFGLAGSISTEEGCTEA